MILSSHADCHRYGARACSNSSRVEVVKARDRRIRRGTCRADSSDRVTTDIETIGSAKVITSS